MQHGDAELAGHVVLALAPVDQGRIGVELVENRHAATRASLVFVAAEGLGGGAGTDAPIVLERPGRSAAEGWQAAQRPKLGVPLNRRRAARGALAPCHSSGGNPWPGSAAHAA